MPLCPCQTNLVARVKAPLAYSDCCQPYHKGVSKAETAERLMRTRYSAFVLINPEYIVKTTVPAQQALLDIKSIESWAHETPWAGLEIVQHTPKLGKRHAQVEFKAYYNEANKMDDLQAHHERSTFVKVKNKADNTERWYFLDPTVDMSVSQKQPCICGSGEKFKRCCGLYL
ncbi:YchJ family protein [Psychrobacter sp. DM8]|uniref:YchJ family protein n=1 Tax=Psychrobacter sp. DM8 TaxID=3440636 RepID=UPI003F4FC8A5